MKKILVALRWIINNSFAIALILLLAVYAYWFRITPFVLHRNPHDDPSFSFLGGIILLSTSGLVTGLLWKLSIKNKANWMALFISLIFLFVNYWYIGIHIPRIITTAKCNGVRYFITYGHPLTDEQWTYTQISEWNGLFKYKSSFNGYAPGSWASKIVCDEEKKEVNIIDDGFGFLEETRGNETRYYERTIAQLDNHLYFISYRCPQYEYNGQKITCSYTLYQCELDYTSCNALPIQFSDDYEGYDENFDLESDEASNTVTLYKNFDEEDQQRLFIYGKESACFVDRCSIIIK